MRPLLRIARRDALRFKARSLLVIAMIALPVLGVTSSEVLYRTYQLSSDQKISRELGSAEAVVTDSGQRSIAQRSGTEPEYSVGAERTGPVPALLPLLPPGSRMLRDNVDAGVISAGDRSTRVTLRDVDYRDPLATGIFFQRSGRSPHVGEVVLSEHLAERLGVSVGASVVRDGAALRVVGLVREAASVNSRVALLTASPTASLGPMSSTSTPPATSSGPPGPSGGSPRLVPSWVRP
jgi:putative ABC transport system permease protein